VGPENANQEGTIELKPENTLPAVTATAAAAPETAATEATPENAQVPVELIPPEQPAVSAVTLAATPETAAPAEPVTEIPSEMKIVITASKSSILIGLQKADCDPQTYQVKDLLGAVKGIPVFLGMAMKVWAKSPRYPKTVEVAPTVMASKPATQKTAPAATSSVITPKVAPKIAPKPAPAPKAQTGMPGL
jgi:hypothetical protein